MERIREWLETNRIYLDILSSIILGGAAVVIAYASYTVTQAELRTAELSEQPHFFIEEKMIFGKDPKNKIILDEIEMHVQNIGSPVYNLKMDVETFIRIDRFNVNFESIFVPVFNYYMTQYYEDKPVGHLSTFKGEKNYKNFYRLVFACSNSDVIEKYGRLDLNLVSITKISYKDRLGRESKTYFWNKSQVTETGVRDFLALAREVPAINLSEITIDTLMAKAQEIQGNLTK